MKKKTHYSWDTQHQKTSQTGQRQKYDLTKSKSQENSKQLRLFFQELFSIH